MDNLPLELLIVFVLLLLNGFFAMSEIALVSARKSRLKQMADEGLPRYARALATAQHPGPLMSTMQVGITLIGILSGALGEATLTENVKVLFAEWKIPSEIAQPLSFGVVVLFITLASVFIGELVPKRIALTAPERIAAAVVGPMKLFSILFYPLERFLTWSSDTILSLLGLKANSEPPVTEEELKVMLREGRDAGVFHEAEQNLAESMLTLNEKGTHGYLTQRVDVEFFEKDESTEDVRRLVLAHPDVEAFPVCVGGMDHVVGAVDSRKILSAFAEGQYQGLAPFLEPPVLVPVSITPLRALGILKEKNAKMLFAVDEYGGIQGVLTQWNILEKLFGELVTADADAPHITPRGDGSFVVDGVLPFADFARFFDCEKDWEPEKGDYHTLAGFILMRMGRIPVTGHYFVWKTFYFEVLAMEGNRVDQVLVRRFEKVTKLPAPATT